jgi:hypothetical protein
LPGLAVLSGWLVLLLEIGYGAFIWSPRTRRYWFVGTVGMHLFIGAFLGMWLFAGIMILLNLAAFGPEARDDFAASWKRPSARARETLLALPAA